MRRLLLPLALTLLVSAGCGDPEEVPERRVEGRIAVRVRTINPRAHHDAVAVTGRLEAFRDATLAAEANGRIIARPGTEGAPIAKDATLLLVDDRRPRLERDRARVAVEEMRLAPDTPAATLRARELDLALAEDALARCRVRAPFAGRLERFSVQIGDWARIGDPVARVVDESDLRLRVRVSGEAALRLEIGAETNFRVRSLGERDFRARLLRIGRAADARDGLYEIELRVDPVAPELRVGMVATSSLRSDSSRSLVALPRRAVFRRYEERFCFVAVDEDGRLLARERRLRVRPLAGQARDWEVLEGLGAGDRLVLGPFVGVADGVELRAEEKGP